MKTLILLLLLCSTAFGQSTPIGVKLSQTESRMISAINKYRGNRGLSPLSVDPILQRVARHRVQIFSHQAFGRSSWHEARSNGYRGSVTDNLAQGQRTAEEAVGNGSSGWGDERRGHTVGHDMQMKGYIKMNGRWENHHFNKIGVAHTGQNWIAVFGN